jgi:hypothetical protein
MPTVPKMLRPRQEFPTPLFRFVLPIGVAAIAALVTCLVL